LFDTNGDGKLGPSEMRDGLSRLGITATQAEVDRLIASVDLNGDKEIQFEEFVQLMEKHTRLLVPEEEVKAAYKLFDKDGDGVITKEELREGMRQLGIEISDADADAMLKEADLNDDGHVSYEEFVRIWRLL
jgi:calmodulin